MNKTFRLVGLTGIVSLLAGVVCAQTATESELVLPSQVPELLDWLLANKAVNVAKYTVIIQAVVQIIKVAAVAFGTKFSEKVTAGMVALVGTLTLVESVLADGQISGSDWSNLFTSVVATVLAFFSYKVVWSAAAPVNK